MKEDVPMGKQSSPRRFSPEFKADAVALLRSSGRPSAEVARELGVGDTTLRTWVHRDSKTHNAQLSNADRKETAMLRKQIKQLETEIEILKRFTAYWVSEQGR
jgi:transposase